MSSSLSHPFPYFGLAVTRDVTRVQEKIDQKYVSAKKLEHHTVLVRKWHEFNEYVVLIADQAGLGKTFSANPEKINLIVDACLKQLEPLVMGYARDNTINPNQVELAKAAAKESFSIDPNEADVYIHRLLGSNNIAITVAPVPVRPREESKPVLDLTAESRPGAIHLHWRMPPTGCDHVLIKRDGVGRGEVVTGDLAWTDRRPEPGREYNYLVYSVVADEEPGAVRSVTAVAQGSVMNLTVAAQRKSTKLSWELPLNTLSVALVRSRIAIHDLVDPRGRLRSLSESETLIEVQKQQEYIDHNVVSSQTYHYVVVARHHGGVCSISQCRAASFAADPAAPQQVNVKVVSGEIHLSWPDVPGAIDPDYVVLVSGSPEPARDGKTKKTLVDQATYGHFNTQPGKRYWYFLWTKLGDLISSQPTCVGPILAVGEVSDLVASVSAEQVELRWAPPPGAKRVEVRRRVGEVPTPPNATQATARERGAMVPVFEAGRVIDTGLSNGTTYVYRISCVYLQPDGHEVTTLGEAITATPCEPPMRVAEIRATFRAAAVRIEWNNAASESVRVFRSKRLPKRRVGARVNLDELDQFGRPLHHVSNERAEDPSPDSVEPYYIVFTSNRFMATYCGFAAYIDVTELELKAENDNLLVRWLWPEGCEEAEVQHMPPGQNHSVHPFSRGQADRAIFILPAIDVGEHVVQVTCKTTGKPHIVAGPGVTKTLLIGTATRIEWELRRKWTDRLKGRASSLIIRVNGRLSRLRSLRLIGKLNKQPDAPTDGRLLASWEATDAAIDGSIEIPLEPWTGRKGLVFCRLFAVPDNELKIVPPPLDSTKTNV